MPQQPKLTLAGAQADNTDLVGRLAALGGYELRVTRGSRRVLICVGRRLYETGLPDVGRAELEREYDGELRTLALSADHTAVCLPWN